MTLHNLLVPTGDAQQAVRVRRFLLASATYGGCIPLLLLAHGVDLLTLASALALVGVILTINVLLYLLFRTGLNLGFADPSLTELQTISAIVMVMCCVYALDRERALALVLCPIIMMFGAFRFRTRDFLSATALVLVSYAAVIGLLLWFKPETVIPSVECFRWLVLAVVLPCFAVIGGKVSELRQHLRRTNDDLGSALAKIQQLATHDTLTGLPNRALFNESLQHALARAERHRWAVALFFMDLDRFKNINDTLGHQLGDQALKEAARRLATCIRGSDIAARLGGDEFVLLVEEFRDPAMLVEIAERVIAVMYQPMLIDGQELNLSASIGICTYPADAQDAQTLLSNADIAMYRAKEQGRNGYRFYSPRINSHSVEKLALEADLRRALERHQLKVYYQPKVKIETGRVTGVEALLRWEHPELGLLLPDRFIHLAEETGLIVPIGLWALQTACRSAKSWQARGLELSVAVNLSARQFHHAQLVSQLAEILRSTELEPSMLEVEITESMVMQNPVLGVSLMRALRRMGVQLTMDDFGTGYSSLAHLKRFPLHNLKLDRTFVRDLPEDINDVAITRAIIVMAHTLHINVVAEGVEREAQLQFLRNEGCDEFQGDLCRPPLPEEQLIRFVQDAASQPSRSWHPRESASNLLERDLRLIEQAARAQGAD